MQIKCPQCGKDVCKDKKQDSPNFPFCSRRCKLVDLGEWFNNKRKITSYLDNERNKGDD